MQKIMFNDHLVLTQAVLDGRKTMTRRVVGNFAPIVSDVRLNERGCAEARHGNVWFPAGKKKNPKYKVGEVVAVARNYAETLKDPNPRINRRRKELLRRSPGWTNKMFVLAELMTHRIRITSVRIERLQDISNEDCMREGVRKLESQNCPTMFTFDGWSFKNKVNRCTDSPKEAFEALFKKLSGKKAWDDNPWVFVYEFELVK